MASKRIKKKRAKTAQEQEIERLIEQAAPFIEIEDLLKLQKSSKTVTERMETITTLQDLGGYISERADVINSWRNQGAQIKYGKVKFHNALGNMEKYHLVKHYWDLVKQGHIKHDYSALEWYNDVADWSLENMSDEELQKVIAEAENKKAKISMKEFSEMVQF